MNREERTMTKGRMVPAMIVLAAAALGTPVGAQCEESTLLHPGGAGAGNQLFGSAVDVSGADLIVGAPAEDGAASGFGIFAWDGLAWTLDFDAFAGAADGEDLGAAAQVDGDLAVAGRPGASVLFAGDGVVTKLQRAAGAWSADASPLTSPAPISGGRFGAALALDADVLVVGEPGGNGGLGAAHVYRRVAGLWLLQQTLTDPTGAIGDAFGASVAVDIGPTRATVLVGAPGFDDSGLADSGAVSFYVWDGGAWDLRDVATLLFESQRMGASVAVEGDHIAIGAPGNDAFGPDGGIIWFGDWDGTDLAEIFGWGAGDGVRMGESVAVGAGRGLAGGTGYAGLDGTITDGGQVFGANKFGDDFPFQSAFYPVGDESAGDRFGASVAIDGTRGAVGVPGHDAAATDAGAVRVYFTPPRAWDWTDLGFALAGTAGVPVLTGEGSLCAGATMRFRLQSARPLSTTFLVLGFEQIDAPFKGGVLVPDPAPPALIVLRPTGPTGDVTIGGEWPAGINPGFLFFAQHWIQDAAGPAGFAASNAVQGRTP